MNPSESPKTLRHCERHGEYVPEVFVFDDPALDPIEMPCQRCADESAARVNQPRAERAEQEMRSAKLRKLVDEAAIPPRYRRSTIEEYQAFDAKQERVKKICRRYVDTWATQRGKGGSLVLTGTPGTGKTHLACAIANEVMAKHMAVSVYGTVANFARSVRASFGKNAEVSERQAIRNMLEPDLLIVDEIGTEAASDYEMRTLFEIIDGRYSHELPMILISNLDLTGLLKHLGPRMMDRFAQCGAVLALDWESYRPKARAAG